MKIVTRNVNGIRAVAEKWFVEWMRSEDADIICLQEPKAFASQIPSSLDPLWIDYGYVRHEGTRPWYAGTAIVYKKSTIPTPSCDAGESCSPDTASLFAQWWSGADASVSDLHTFPRYQQLIDDGRMTDIIIGDVCLINCYFPNGNPRADGREMLDYKLSYYDALADYVQWCKDRDYKVIVTGDFNICHRPIDIARPKENENSIGFLPIERAKIGWLMDECHLVDAFRHCYPDRTDAYTRWSYRAGARPRNVWRRLDYMMVDTRLVDRITTCEHADTVMGSDHCPVRLILW